MGCGSSSRSAVLVHDPTVVDSASKGEGHKVKLCSPPPPPTDGDNRQGLSLRSGHPAAQLGRLEDTTRPAGDSVCPDVTAAARRLAAATGSGAACCIVTATDQGVALRCGVGGTRQTVSSTPHAHRVHQRDVERCAQMLVDIIGGDAEGAHRRCQPGWMSREQWVDFWKGIGPTGGIDGGSTVQVAVSSKGKFAPNPATHAAIVGAGGREWHVQACWNDDAVTGLWVAPLARAEFASVISASAGDDSSSSPSDCEVEDRWHLGSCTKAMTSTLLAVLVEDGVVCWDSTLGATVSGVFDGGELPNCYGDITLQQLLANESGVPGTPCPEGLWALAWRLHNESGKPPKEQRREFAREFIIHVPLHTSPGASPKYAYNNVNFTLAALMAEEMTGQSWEDLMTERLFVPLEMSSAGFGAPGAQTKDFEARRSHPWPHKEKGDGREMGHEMLMPVDPASVGADNPDAVAPAGKCHSSLRDWAKYLAVHLDDSIAREKLGLSRQTLEALESHKRRESRDNGYAGGWFFGKRGWARCAQDAEGWTLMHSGSNTMNFCTVWLAPGKGLGVLACCNTCPGGYGRVEAVVAKTVAELLEMEHGGTE